ncbi:hypothetical protein D3C81_2263360 [compost metagenome]
MVVYLGATLPRTSLANLALLLDPGSHPTAQMLKDWSLSICGVADAMADGDP